MAGHVVVAGGGITGLVTAWALRRHPSRPAVTLFEADDRLGGKILGTPFAGLPNVEAGPDMFLTRVPWALELCADLGLGDRLVHPTTGRAYVWHRGRLHPIPAGLVLGVPAGVASLARSSLLSWRGKARAAVEPLLPRTDPGDNLGRFLRRRFGDEVVELLVDPLIGGINAGDADHLSLGASAPQLADAAGRRRSMLLSLRGQAPAGTGTAAPPFATPEGGLGTIVAALAAGLDGVDVRLGTPAPPVEPAGAGRWRVGDVEADAVVAAVPAFRATDLLGTVAPEAASIARGVPYASVAVVTLAVPEAAIPRPLDASGHLVPKPEQRHLTACSWASSKWAHWRVPGQVVLRASLGRFGDEHAIDLDDDALVAAALDDLAEQIGLAGDPTEVRITRWARSFPQYLPGHAGRVAALARSLPPGVVVAGAAYGGVGIPACIRHGREAAAAVAARLPA